MARKLFIFHAFKPGALQADLFPYPSSDADEVMAEARRILCRHQEYDRVEIWTDGSPVQAVRRSSLDEPGRPPAS